MPQSPNSQGKQPTDPYGAQALALAQRCIDAVRQDAARQDRDKQDWLNLLGYKGGVENWWVQFDGNSNVWRTLPESDDEHGLPPEVPRQASNIYRRKIDGIAAILNQAQPAQEWRPAKDDDAARATADVIDEALPVLREECDYDGLRNLINLHVTLTDKVGFELYFDADEKYGTEMIQALQCAGDELEPGCGWQGMPMEVEDAGDVCPGCQRPGETLQPMVDQNFEPIGVHYPKGKICGRLIPSFEISLPPSARECHEQKVPYLVTHTNMAREDAMRMWKDKAQFIKRAKTETAAGNSSAQYASAMRNVASPAAATRGMTPQLQDTVLVWRVVHDPIEDAEEQFSFPEGLDIVIIDGEVIASGPLELKDDQGCPMKPILLRTYVQSPGSPFGSPIADDLGVLQRQRNLIETLMLLILMHNASPTTWVPTTVTLEDDIQRTPGSVHRYRSNLPGERPVTETGVNPPEGLFRFIEMNDAAFDTVSGLNAVLEGQRPEGDPTKGEIEILQERGMATFKAPLDQLTDFEKRVSYTLLQIARQSLWTARLIRTVGENGDWSIKEFTNADLHGSVDVFVNAASAWPKSQLLQQLRLKDAIEMGVINPADPEIAEQVLSDFDLTHFKPSLDKDRKQIARELDRWKAASSPAEITPPGAFINVPMHLHYKSQWMKTEEAEAIQQLNPPVWQAMNMHIQMLQLAAAPAPAPGAEGPGGPGKGPKGDQPPNGATLETMLQNGTLKPAQGPPPSPLEGMLQDGRLRPAPQDNDGYRRGFADRAVQSQGKTGPSVDEMTAQRERTGRVM